PDVPRCRPVSSRGRPAVLFDGRVPALRPPGSLQARPAGARVGRSNAGRRRARMVVRAPPATALFATLLAASAAARPAAAQVGVTTDLITGLVTGPDSQPLAGAVVRAVSVA